MNRSTSERVLRGVVLSGALALSHCTLPQDSCFVAGTLVATPGGPRPIEALAVGDEVWACDPRAGVLVARRVVALHRALARETRSLCAGDRTMRGVTPSHPVYSLARGEFVPARELRVGEALLGFDAANVVPLVADEFGADERPLADIAVYNLTVEGPEHTYFADGLLVHNKSYSCEGVYYRVEVNEPEGPLPPGTTSYVIKAEYDSADLIEADRIYAWVWHPEGVSQAPTFGPLTSDDGGRTWSFEIRGLEPVGPYRVEVSASGPPCPPIFSFGLELEVAP